MPRKQSIPGRADTDRKKGLVFEKILRAWKLVPEMRLGELLFDSVNFSMARIEDDDLADYVVAHARDKAGVTVKKARK